MAGSCLYIATIGTDRFGRVRLIKSMSREFELHGSDQVSLITFTTFVRDFLKAKEISSLTLISSPRAGGHMAGANTYKIEAALQLLPVTVVLVPSGTITHFARKEDESVPGPDSGRLYRQEANLQQRAILAAAYTVRQAAAVEHLASKRFAHGLGEQVARQYGYSPDELTRQAILKRRLASATTFEERAAALVDSL